MKTTQKTRAKHRRNGARPTGNGNGRGNLPRGRRARSKRETPADTTRGEDNDVARTISVSGVLELHPRGYGFLRDAASNYSPSPDDAFVPEKLIQRFGLRPGNTVNGQARRVRAGEGPLLEEVYDVDGLPPERYSETKDFGSLTPINPESWLRLETGPEPLTTLVIDLLTPLGKGQRGLIVAPPRSGKTVLLQHIGQAVAANHPDVKLLVLLVDERPEEVTDMRRQIPGDVLASSLDRDVESHVRLSQLVVERAKRLAEEGHDVLLLIDSLTRMSRAFNKWVGNTGRTMTGGVDIKALDIPKKLFASARAFEEGGSLTILGTVLIETGSRMDDLIFEEFKGTGNMELVLDRRLADKRIWPAIDLTKSGTRREEKLLDAHTLRAVTLLRRTLSTMHPVDAMEQLTTQLSRHRCNREFIELISRQATL